MQSLSQSERQILRDLAKRQAEIAGTPHMRQLVADWYAHNDLKGSRPMFTVETWTFQQDIPLETARCESPFARDIEHALLLRLANHQYVKDDTVVPDVFPVGVSSWFKPFGLEVKRQELTGSIGHQFVHQIKDLEDDFHLLGPSVWGSSGMAAAQARVADVNEVFGDILPAQLVPA